MAEEGSSKTKGKRKVDIKKIENKRNLEVSFSKRKKGLFNMASELSILCDAKVAVVLTSISGKKFFLCGDPDLEAILARNGKGSIHEFKHEKASPESISEYNEALRKLDKEKNSLGISVGDMDLLEVEKYIEALELEKIRVLERVEFLEKNPSKASSLNLRNSATLDDGDESQLAALTNHHHDQYFHVNEKTRVENGWNASPLGLLNGGNQVVVNNQGYDVEQNRAENHWDASSSCLMNAEYQAANYPAYNVDRSRAPNPWVASSSSFPNGVNRENHYPSDSIDEIQALLNNQGYNVEKSIAENSWRASSSSFWNGENQENYYPNDSVNELQALLNNHGYDGSKGLF